MGIAKLEDGDVLYRSNKHFGLTIKNVNEVNRRLRVIKWHIMKIFRDFNHADSTPTGVYVINKTMLDKAGSLHLSLSSSMLSTTFSFDI